jgi:predicted nucleic acid-binding protein
MILADTDILSAMAKITRLPLLFSLLQTTELNITPGVFTELEHSFNLGRDYAQDIFALLAAGKFAIAYLMPDEVAFRDTLPVTLGAGERESIAVAHGRGAIVLSNESRVAHSCKQYGVDCLRLPDILRALWTESIVSKQEVQLIIGELQQKDRMQFKQETLDAIFADP